MKRMAAFLLAALIAVSVFSVSLADCGRVRVTFTLKDQFGDPVEGAVIYIAKRNSSAAVKEIITSSKGKASAELGPGKYQVNGYALPDGYYWDNLANSPGSPVKLFTVGEKNRKVALTCACRTEKVRITTKDPYTGQNVGKVRLQIYDGDGKKVMSVRTNTKGRTTVRLKSGNYQIGVSQAPEGYAGLRIIPVKVKEGKTASWTVQVLPKFTCKVKVLDSRGKPVSGATVWIHTVKAVTNRNGIATFRNSIIYGEWDVAVWATLNGETYVPYMRKRTLKTGTGETIRWTIRLPDESKWHVKPELEV